MSIRSLYLAASFFLLPLSLNAQEESALNEPLASIIADNSFLLEEAYNQEAGVVQHVNTFDYDMDAGDWAYEFSQEWPLWGQEHQISYGVPVNKISVVAQSSANLGDITVDYRYQILTDPRFACAPRVSCILPTGSTSKGGSLGFEAGLPASYYLLDELVAHTNIGATYFPKAKMEEVEGRVLGFNVGQSFVWLAHEHFNVLVEGVWERESISINDVQITESVLIVNPGIRWSHDFDNGLQIVPGISAPIAMTSDESQVGLFFYLSFEHSF